MARPVTDLRTDSHPPHLLHQHQSTLASPRYDSFEYLRRDMDYHLFHLLSLRTSVRAKGEKGTTFQSLGKVVGMGFLPRTSAHSGQCQEYIRQSAGSSP